MNVAPINVQAFVISAAPTPPNRGALDPITVFLHDVEPGRGGLTVQCFGAAWTCWWGAMGNGHNVLRFLRGCDAEYVADSLIRGRRQWISSRRNEQDELQYLTLICGAVIAHAKACEAAS